MKKGLFLVIIILIGVIVDNPGMLLNAPKDAVDTGKISAAKVLFKNNDLN